MAIYFNNRKVSAVVRVDHIVKDKEVVAQAYEEAWKKGAVLPTSTSVGDGYQELNYVYNGSTTNGSWFDTGINPQGKPRVVIEFSHIYKTANNYDLFGHTVSSGSCLYAYVNTDQKLTGRFGNQNETMFGVVMRTGKKYKLDMSDKVYLNDELIYTFANATYTHDASTSTIRIMNGNRNTTACQGRFYSFKLYDGENLVRDMIPCMRLSDRAVGFWDKVSQSFFENQQTTNVYSGGINFYQFPFEKLQETLESIPQETARDILNEVMVQQSEKTLEFETDGDFDPNDQTDCVTFTYNNTTYTTRNRSYSMQIADVTKQVSFSNWNGALGRNNEHEIRIKKYPSQASGNTFSKLSGLKEMPPVMLVNEMRETFSQCSLEELKVFINGAHGYNNYTSGTFAYSTALKKITLIGWVNGVAINMLGQNSALTEVDAQNLDMSKATTMPQFFYRYSTAQPQVPLAIVRQHWVLTSVTTLLNFAQRCYFLETLGDTGKWGLGNVTTLSTAFSECTSLRRLDADDWHMPSLTTMVNVFNSCSNLEYLAKDNDISNWNPSSLTNMSYAFAYCYHLKNLTAKNWNMPSLTTMERTFLYAGIETLDITGWNTPSLNTMAYTFSYCSALKSIAGIGNLDVSQVTTFHSAFLFCMALESMDLSDWDVGSATIFSLMFSNCRSITSVGDLSGWNTENVTAMSSMFSNCSKLQSLNVSSWDTSSATTMADIFYNCSVLTSLDLSSWDVGEVTTMANFARNTYALTTLGDISDWRPVKCTNFSNSFSNAKALQSFNGGSWVTGAVTTMESMFYTCSAITSIDVRGFNTSNLTTINSAFRACPYLVSLGLCALPNGCNTESLFTSSTALTTITMNDGDKINCTVSFYPCPLSATSVLVVLNHLSTTGSGKTITFKSGLYRNFTAADKTLIDAARNNAVTNGWTINNMS